jgi:hypothetical protein
MESGVAPMRLIYLVDSVRYGATAVVIYTRCLEESGTWLGVSAECSAITVLL